MWKRLPSWIGWGAFLLAFLAGMVNVVGLLSVERIALTHMTGLTSRLAQGIAEADPAAIAIVAAVMGAFVAGATLSGILLPNSALQWGHRYGIALGLEGLLLTAAACLAPHQPHLAFCFAAFACGLQNAMASHFSGSTIRTTHVSGMFTDLGLALGHHLCGHPVDSLRIRLSLTTITGFLAGGILGVSLFHHLGTTTLFIPAAMAYLLAALYLLLLHRRSHIMENEPTENPPPKASIPQKTPPYSAPTGQPSIARGDPREPLDTPQKTT